MSTFKKLLALTLALAMVLSVSAFAGYSKDTYKDAAAINEDCEEAIELMYALKIMKGDNNGNFNPEATITRAEMVKMIYVILNYGKDDLAVNYKGAKIFADVNAGDWFEGYVNFAATTKLVQGRGNGTFGPNDPVTTAEAAKMLLTAIGYSAEARGYTGANWAQNVLSDAQILGLLKGYNYSTTGYAPRQWVAVMVENALGCYTFDTMKPTFSGLLVSGEAQTAYDTMGRKYYDLEIVSAYLYATEDAYIDRVEYKDKTKSTYAPDDCLLFSDGTVIESDELGYMDLGQKFRVIYDYDDNDVVYSIRPITSAVADSIIMDIEVDNAYATSSNDAKNKYVFTVDSMEAKFETYEIPALTVEYNGKNTGKPGTINAAELKEAAGTKSADLYRAVDKNADGEIDYMIIVPYTYAAVTKVGEHANYGTYFTATDVNGNTYKPAGYTGDKWYLDDVVNTDDEIVKGNYIKVNYNLDNGAYDVEVLDVAEGVVYEKRTTKGVHTLGDTEYVVGVKGFEAAAEEKVLVSANLKEEMDVVYDGTLVIYAEVCDSNYADLAEINAQLVLVTDAYYDKYNGNEDDRYDRHYIEYLTIDGELHEEVRYHDSKAESADYGVAFEDIEGMLDENYRLFALREKDGKVYLLDLYTDKDNSQAILDYSSSLLDGYKEIDPAAIDTKDNEIGDDYIENENVFFISYLDKYNDVCFDVMTIDELNEGITKNDNGAYGLVQGLYETKRSYDNYLAGHLYLGKLDLYQATGYLYTTSAEIYELEDDGYDMLTDVFFNDDAEEGVEIAVDLAAGQTIYANRLYSYTYDRVNGEKVYTLTLVNDADTTQEFVDVTYSKTTFVDGADKELVNAFVADDGDKTIAMKNEDGKTNLVLASTNTIALRKVVMDRNQNQPSGWNDDLSFSIETSIDFVTFDELIAEDEDGESLNRIFNGEYDDTYNYYSDVIVVKNDSGKVKMLYVITYAVEKEAQIDEVNNGTGEINGVQYFAVSESREQFSVEIDNLYFEDEVQVYLYCGNEVLTVATNTGALNSTTTCAVLLKGESSSWDVDAWTPDADLMPTRVELVVDGEVKDSAPITVGYTDNVGDPIYLTAGTWADIVAGL